MGDDDYDDEIDFDCHMMQDGQCLAAGSEECDWECPVMARFANERIEAMKKSERRRRRKGGQKSLKL